MLVVQHQHAFDHGVEQRVARHRHQLEQPVAVHGVGVDRAGEGEGEGGRIQARHGREAAEISHVGDPGDQCAGEQGGGLTPIDHFAAHDGVQQLHRTDQDQQIIVQGGEPEGRAVRVNEVGAGRVGRGFDFAPEPAVLFVAEHQRQGRGRNDPQPGGSQSRTGAVAPRILARKQDPQHGHADDAQVFESGPVNFGACIDGDRLQHAEQFPGRGCDHQQHERRSAGRAAPRPGGQGDAAGEQCCQEQDQYVSGKLPGAHATACAGPRRRTGPRRRGTLRLRRGQLRPASASR